MATRYDVVVCAHEDDELTLDVVAVRAGMHPALVREFVEFGLIQPMVHEHQQGAMFFDDSAVLRLRMIQRLRESLGINLSGVAVILDLLERLHTLQRENESLRSRL